MPTVVVVELHEKIASPVVVPDTRAAKVIALELVWRGL